MPEIGCLPESERVPCVSRRFSGSDPGPADGPGGRSPGRAATALGSHVVKVTVLVGGVGGARFLQGLKSLFGDSLLGDEPENEITAVVNVGDDIWIALAWCVGLLVVAYGFAMLVYRRRLA